MEEVYKYYNDTAEYNERLAGELKKKMNLGGTIRLLLFVGLIVALIVVNGDWKVITAVVSLFAVPFILSMVYHTHLSRQRTYAETLAQLCRDELKALGYDFSGFDGAADKINPSHPFIFDLDIFGERSLFQSLNRTVTRGGREELAGWFLNPLDNREQILKRQASINELADYTQLRQDFYVTGKLKLGGRDPGIISAISRMDAGFASGAFWRFAVWCIPVLWVVVFAGSALGLVSGGIVAAFFLLSVFLSNAKVAKVNRLYNSVDKADKTLSAYSGLIGVIESTGFNTDILGNINHRLSSGDVIASREIKRLSGLLGALDQRANILIIILNIFTMRDIRLSINIDRWKKRNMPFVEGWIRAVEDFDALSSLAGFAYNHPGYIYPEIAGSYFEMSGKGLGHPLLDRAVCVKNDINVMGAPYFMIVTGANMAGKSTYLRTIGVNFVLSCVGAPVCADELRVYPARIVTSLRTSDSLADNESYFYAELKRLKMIIDRLKSGERLFIILDEILKGTNSADKQKGSLALVRQFVSHGACGIIATHDLVLGTLHDELPEYVRNYRFEAEIRGDRLSFPYKLQEGVARNMNAYFLMQKMGITV